MNKKMIIIIVLVIVTIILGIILINRRSSKQNESEYSYKIKTEEERKEDYKENITEIENILKDGGLKLTNKQECRENELDEEGYSYKVDGQTIEIYRPDGLKLEELIRRNSETSLEVNLKSKNIFSKPAICYANTLILNADTNLRKKIINILQES